MTTPTAFITGASRGIGRGIALVLAQHGFDIVGAATKASPADAGTGLYEVKARVEEMGRRFLPVTGDLSDLEWHAPAIERAYNEFGRIDLLVNNAGIAPPRRLDILETTSENFERVMRVNLEGPFFFTQRFANRMVSERDSSADPPQIVFITSISATTASPNRAEYCVSKAGLSMTAQNFAVRLAEHGINVYEIQPGIIKTDMTATVAGKYDTLIQSGLLLQNRWGRPEDVAQAVLAIAERRLAYATGAVIEVGGGFGVKRL